LQAGYQLAGVALTLGLAIFSGLLAGYITSRSWFEPPPPEYLFDDTFHFAKCVIEHEKLKDLKEAVEKTYNAGSKSGNQSDDRAKK
jgi:hypothetical protein